MTSASLACALLTFVASPHLSAQSPAPTEKPHGPVLLWSEKAPGALGEATKDKPSILVYAAKSDSTKGQQETTPAILICPGGGYGHLAKNHEGDQIAKWLNTIGITGVVLNYRHRGKGYTHPAPLHDAQRAMRMVRHHANEWRIDNDKVGVLGFSAGGHLASSVSVHHDAGHPNSKDPIERQSCRPDYSILCYAVIAFNQPFTHRGSQHNLLGKNAANSLVNEMSSERQIDKTTPPAFLWHTSNDGVVPPQNAISYYMALLEHKVPCEIHIFENGRHGIGLGKGMAAEQWSELCKRWLIERSVLSQ
jgi:acetyl esterase/lipase